MYGSWITKTVVGVYVLYLEDVQDKETIDEFNRWLKKILVTPDTCLICIFSDFNNTGLQKLGRWETDNSAETLTSGQYTDAAEAKQEQLIARNGL